MPKDLYEIGEIPPLGEVPARMYAQVIRPERFGEPVKAFQVEEIAVPEIGPHDALVLVMAAGINYNNVWAALGIPVDVTKVHGKFGEPDDFHIGGSDASGVVYAVGDQVTNVKVGDQVVVHCGQWDPDDPVAVRRRRPDVRAVVPHLGLRVELGILRAVHEGPGPPVHAQGPPPDVGAGRGPDAGRRDRLPDAPRLAAARRPGGRRRPGVGRGRRPRHHGHPAGSRGRRAGRRRRLERREGRVLQEARRGRLHQPQGLRPLGDAARTGRTTRASRRGWAARRRSARRSGRPSARSAARGSSSSTPARTPCPPRSSCATPAAWS